MAEYKNGVNFRGNMSVEKNDVNSDVQTGRAIFVDEDKYEKDSVYKAKVDKCLAEGFHRVDGSSEGGSSGGGGGAEPLIVNFDHIGTGTMISYYDKSWQEVYDAAKVGSNVVLINEDGIYTLSYIMDELGKLIAVFGSESGAQGLTTDSADGYLHSEPVI